MQEDEEDENGKEDDESEEELMEQMNTKKDEEEAEQEPSTTTRTKVRATTEGCSRQRTASPSHFRQCQKTSWPRLCGPSNL